MNDDKISEAFAILLEELQDLRRRLERLERQAGEEPTEVSSLSRFPAVHSK